MEKVKKLTEEFFNKFLKIKNRDLAFSEIYDLVKDWLPSEQYPNGNSPGIYFLLDKNKDIYYIGCSKISISSRLNVYFKYDKQDRNKCYKTKGSEDVFYIITYPMENDLKYFVYSLELYLIEKVRPKVNKVGK